MPIKISSRDHKKAAEFIVDEQRRRQANRRDREKDWKEIDRQLRMEAVPLESKTGELEWFPAIELPLQANAREILSADMTRLIFPAEEDWYRAEAQVTDEWERRFENHETVGGVAAGSADQDTANIIVHGALDHFHRQYDYKGAWKKLIKEGISYGTFVGRFGLVKTLNITNDFRRTANRVQPVLIPVSIKDTYLDDTESFTLQEGVRLSPSFIRRTWHNLKDLKRQGGEWFNLEGLEASSKDKPNHVEVLEFEGDLIIERSRKDNQLFPNMRVTVAVQSEPRVIRWKKLDLPFRSYIKGIYEDDETSSPYGTSPLVKGRPIQVAATLATNTTLAVSMLQALPPVVYDAEDRALKASGGPAISPNAKIEAENAIAVKPLEIGDLNAAFAMLTGLLAQYEDTTKVNDPRRGAQTKSHTTATAKDIELSRGLLPTEDVVNGIEEGPMTTSLYMEYELARRSLKTTQTIYIDARGTKGHFEIDSSILPENSDFVVMGSRGEFDKRRVEANFAEFMQVVTQLTPILVNPQAPPELGAMIVEFGRKKGITDVERFIPAPGEPQDQIEGAEPGPGIQEGA